MDIDILAGSVFWSSVLAATLRMAIPIYLAGLGEIFCERSGVLNIGIEGQMLAGALAAFAAAYYSGSLLAGLLAGAAAGMLIAFLVGFLCVKRQLDQTIVGVLLNIFCLGAASFFYRVLFGVSATPPTIPQLPELSIPLLRDIPLLGPALFQQTIFVYAALFSIPLASWLLFRTPLGLKLRAAGENPKAAETMGVDVEQMRFLGVLLGGGLAGIAGAFLSLALLGRFVDNITAGRGFIALAIVIFGGWKPHRVFGAALLFGFAEAFQLRLQAVGMRIPYQFLLMFPYVLTVIVLAATSRRIFAPAALGRPYGREKS